MDEELAYADVFSLQSERVPPVELTALLLERVRALDAPGSPTELRSVLAVSPAAMDEAERSAKRAGAGARLPLAGIPVLVKDNIEVAGLPSCAGATSLASRTATRDAPLVARLRAAGAIIIGTANLSEWANTVRRVPLPAGPRSEG